MGSRVAPGPGSGSSPGSGPGDASRSREGPAGGGAVEVHQESSDAEMEADLTSFADHLDQFASSLDERDRRLLEVVLWRALSPVEQLRLRDAAGLLDEEEQAVLAELKDAGG